MDLRMNLVNATGIIPVSTGYGERSALTVVARIPLEQLLPNVHCNNQNETIVMICDKKKLIF